MAAAPEHPVSADQADEHALNASTAASERYNSLAPRNAFRAETLYAPYAAPRLKPISANEFTKSFDFILITTIYRERAEAPFPYCAIQGGFGIHGFLQRIASRSCSTGYHQGLVLVEIRARGSAISSGGYIRTFKIKTTHYFKCVLGYGQHKVVRNSEIIHAGFSINTKPMINRQSFRLRTCNMELLALAA